MEQKQDRKILLNGSYSHVEAIPVIEAIPLTNDLDPEGSRIDEVADVPIAFALEEYTSSNNPEAKSYEIFTNTRLGTDLGQVKTRQEKEAIIMTSQHARSKNRQEEERVRIANEIAKNRIREGFDIREDKYHNVEAYVLKKVEKEEQKLAQNVMKQRNTGKGYEPKEYDVTEYEGEKEYDVSEYTSIYEK